MRRPPAGFEQGQPMTAVTVDRSGRIATVVLHRPAVRNAVDPATAADLAAAFLDLDAAPDIRAMVLWDAGGTFCAGADLQAVAHGWAPRGCARPTVRRATATARWGRRAWNWASPWLRRRPDSPWPADWSSHCDATCAWPRRTRPSACTAAAGACR